MFSKSRGDLSSPFRPSHRLARVRKELSLVLALRVFILSRPRRAKLFHVNVIIALASSRARRFRVPATSTARLENRFPQGEGRDQARDSSSERTIYGTPSTTFRQTQYFRTALKGRLSQIGNEELEDLIVDRNDFRDDDAKNDRPDARRILRALHGAFRKSRRETRGVSSFKTARARVGGRSRRLKRDP